MLAYEIWRDFCFLWAFLPPSLTDFLIVNFNIKRKNIPSYRTSREQEKEWLYPRSSFSTILKKIGCVISAL